MRDRHVLGHSPRRRPRNLVSLKVLREGLLPVLLYGVSGLFFLYRLGSALAALDDQGGFLQVGYYRIVAEIAGTVPLLIVCAGRVTAAVRRRQSTNASPAGAVLFYAGLAASIWSLGMEGVAEVYIIFGVVHAAAGGHRENVWITALCGGAVVIEVVLLGHAGAAAIVLVSFAFLRSQIFLLDRYDEMYHTTSNRLHAATSALAGLTHENNQLNARYEASVRSIIQSERKRIALEIHDTVGHTLAALLRKVELFRAFSRNQDPARGGGQAAWDATLREFETSIRESIARMRREVSSLRMAKEEVDWVGSYRTLCESFAKYSEVDVQFVLYDELPRIANNTGSAVYRIMQEALTNALRHGHAERVSVMLGLDDEGTTIYLKVSDDGLGCATVVPGSGLSSITARAKERGGFVSWKTANLQGFDLGVEIPLDE